jgi:hypothetical protein
MIDIELLYFDGCPKWENARDELRAVVRDMGLAERANVRLVRVDDEAHARRLEFAGSPTIRVNGRDIEPESDEPREFGLQCRVYRVDGRLRGFPPRDLIRASLEECTK